MQRKAGLAKILPRDDAPKPGLVETSQGQALLRRAQQGCASWPQDHIKVPISLNNSLFSSKESGPEDI